MVGIYKITSPSGKIYIGKSANIERRFKEHKACNNNTAPLLYKSIRKYGADMHVFEIITTFPEDTARSVVDQHEIFCINQFKEGRFKMLNLAQGGTGGNVGEAAHKLIGEKRRGSIPWNKGIPQTEEVKRKLSESKKGSRGWNKGIKQSDEAKRKFKEWRKLNPLVFSQETIDKIQKTKAGYRHSEETKAKIREKLMGHSISDETRALWSKQRKGVSRKKIA